VTAVLIQSPCFSYPALRKSWKGTGQDGETQSEWAPGWGWALLLRGKAGGAAPATTPGAGGGLTPGSQTLIQHPRWAKRDLALLWTPSPHPEPSYHSPTWSQLC